MKINKIRKIFYKEKVLIAILILASILRFYNYPNRWGLAYDQAWFAVISRHALETLQLPLLGPFASGGPFQTGGEWFWIVMTGIALNPFWYLSPWVFITMLSVLQVFLLFILGKEVINRKFGYILALFGAISTSQTLQATNLTNQMPTSICATFLILFIVRYIKTKKEIYLFLQGISVGLAVAIHLQGILLVPVLFISVILTKSFGLRQLLYLGLGLLVPWMPVFIADAQNNFRNTINMLSYFTQPQSQSSYEALGRRWLTFLLVYIPSAWGRIIGGYTPFGYIIVILSGIFFLYQALWKKKLSRFWWIIFLSTGAIFVILRYIRTPLYENYITFAHPFVFLVAGIVIYSIIKKTKIAGFLLLGGVVAGSVIATVMDVKNSSNYTAVQADRYVEILKQKYPGEQFAIFDYKYGTTNKSLPLVYFLQTEKLIDDNGRRIGLTVATSGAQVKFNTHTVIDGGVGGYQLFDLSSSNSADLQKNEWTFINPSRIYDSVQNWYKK